MIVEGWVIVKGVGLIGTAFGAYATYRTFPDVDAKAKMMQCFKLGDICLKKKNKDKETKIYPKIHTVKISENTEIFFTLPLGLDPAIVHKHEWIFYQKFGTNIDFTGDTKNFTLTIYRDPIEPFEYDFTVLRLNQKIPIVAGMSRQGFEIYDMVDHPHLLIAGETGSGKSVCLRQILTTLILNKTKMELYCADLKRSEFHLFKGIAKEVVVEVKKLESMLYKIKDELKKRGDLLDSAELSHVEDLKNKLPYIILAIDEVALLKKEKVCMEIIEEISAIGRSLGVFLILSMQRPDADVLDGKLKNNLTVRMAFRHSDEINSRITIGSGEASHIKQNEKGKMIFKLNELKTVQAPYLELLKAKQLLKEYKKPIQKVEDTEEAIGGLDD